MARFSAAVIALTLAGVATAQVCSSGSCWTSPSNATDHGCQTWAGGVDAWATCGFEGAVTCTTCLPCNTEHCYTSPSQATGAGCTAWAGGVDVWQTCGFDGAITCRTCAA
ncbi:unnamed protein product [Mycena citricolor]|uniref:Uncharacterized protein n=1 Tax=Mycena citricolor TaxID=2018698 RepID=A0AAD2Q7V8_9AGAR|nr:unnamed protein product [Mycena citricolor]